jgi:hypothetical protein
MARHRRRRVQWRRIVQCFVVEPAQAKVTQTAEIMAGVDALVRGRGREPGPWPISVLVRAQIELAHGVVHEEFAFPPIPEHGTAGPAGMGGTAPELGSGL